MDHSKAEIAQSAARLVVEEGMDYGAAKQRAARLLGLQGRIQWPDNDELEQAVREHIEIFCPDTQPRELAALRRLALLWMERLADFRPHLAGAVWHGTATRLSDIHIQLFCDDSKAAEIALIDRGVSYQARRIKGFHGREVDALSLDSPSTELQASIGIHLMIHDYDDLRGALSADRQDRTPRGNLAAVKRLVEELEHER